jgi:signal transduction histidine kinase
MQFTHVQLRLREFAQPLVVHIDPRLIKRAMFNLILNVLQAMPSCGELIIGAVVHSPARHHRRH